MKTKEKNHPEVLEMGSTNFKNDLGFKERAESTVVEFVIPASVNVSDVIAKAREKFYADENVIGVGVGPRRVSKKVRKTEFALLVYVKNKKPELSIQKNFIIPKEFMGLKTDVIEIFSEDSPKETVDYVSEHHHSHDMAFIDWARLHTLRVEKHEIADSIEALAKVEDFGDVCVIEDDGTLVMTINGVQQVDFVRAYHLFRTLHGDDYDHVSFVLDTASGMPTQCACSFFSWIYNDVKGIGLGNINGRATWGTTRLQGYHFMNQGHFPVWRYVMGQEWFHQFAAFAKYKDPVTGAAMNDHLLGGWGHWALNFDDDRSPMDYDTNDWVELPSGNFRKVSRTSDERTYCDLDLYLMGLYGPREAGEFYLLRNTVPVPGSATDFTATKVTLKAQDFVNQEGPRIPSVSTSQKFFRQAFIVLTKDITKVHDLVDTVDFLRLKWEKDFPDMTKGIGKIDTVLDSRPGRITPNQIAELIGGGYTNLHRHKIGANDLQVVGTQFTGHLNVGQSQRWFTYAWPQDWFVQWSLRPTTAGGKVKFNLTVERGANNTFTYWITVSNDGTIATNFEAKYAILK